MAAIVVNAARARAARAHYERVPSQTRDSSKIRRSDGRGAAADGAEFVKEFWGGQAASLGACAVAAGVGLCGDVLF
jgi:hypothetical protein